MDSKIYIPKKVHELLNAMADILNERDSFTNQLTFFKAYADILRKDFLGGGDLFHLDFSNWHPKYIGQSIDDIRLSTPSELKFLEATIYSHGYRTIDYDFLSSRKICKSFEQAVTFLVHGKTEQLKNMLQGNLSLVHRSSGYGHQAGLIHYVAANGVESYRQMCPYNICEVLEIVIKAGADINQQNNIYGGSGLKTLIETSAHPDHIHMTNELLSIVNRYK